MAESPQLQVRITADGGQMTKSLSSLQAQLGRFRTALTTATDPAQVARLNRAIQATEGRMKALNSHTGGNSPAAKMSKDFTGLSRVIQDLPFGFIAISNNLTQLLPAAGGLGLAFSALVAGLTFASTGLANWTRGLDGSKESIQKTTTELSLLEKQLEDSTDRLDDMASTLDFINKLAKIRIELTLGEGLSTDLEDLRAQRIGNLEKVTAIAAALKEAKDNQAAAYSRLLAAIGDDNELFEAATQGILGSYADKLSDEQAKIFQTYETLSAGVKKLARDERAASEATRIYAAQIAAQKVAIEKEAQKKRLEAIQRALEAENAEMERVLASFPATLRNFVAGESIPLYFVMRMSDNKAARIDSPTHFQRYIQDKLGNQTIPTRVNIAPQIEFKEPTDFEKKLEEFRAKTNDLLKSAMTNAAAGFAEGIGEAFAGGGLDKAFQNVAAVMGEFLQSLGKMLIQEAIKVELFKKAFAKLLANPAAAIAVGAGMIALGAIIKKTVMPKPKAFAQGGLVYGPTLGLVGEGRGTNANNPEIISPLDKLKGMIGDVSSAPDYLPAHRFSFSELVMWYERGGKHMRRHQ